MKEQLVNYKYQASKVLRLHQAFIVLVAALILLIGVVLRINQLGSLPVDQAFLDQESSKVKSVKFDEKSIEQMKALNDSNVSVPDTALTAGRQNPFNE